MIECYPNLNLGSQFDSKTPMRSNLIIWHKLGSGSIGIKNCSQQNQSNWMITKWSQGSSSLSPVVSACHLLLLWLQVLVFCGMFLICVSYICTHLTFIMVLKVTEGASGSKGGKNVCNTYCRWLLLPPYGLWYPMVQQHFGLDVSRLLDADCTLCHLKCVPPPWRLLQYSSRFDWRLW